MRISDWSSDVCSSDLLALVDDRFLVLVQEFDRILDGEDMPGGVGIAMVDHARQGGGLARAGRADHQHQATRLHHDVLEDRGQLELFDRRDLAVDGARSEGHTSELQSLMRISYA